MYLPTYSHLAMYRELLALACEACYREDLIGGRAS